MPQPPNHATHTETIPKAPQDQVTIPDVVTRLHGLARLARYDLATPTRLLATGQYTMPSQGPTGGNHAVGGRIWTWHQKLIEVRTTGGVWAQPLPNHPQTIPKPFSNHPTISKPTQNHTETIPKALQDPVTIPDPVTGLHGLARFAGYDPVTPPRLRPGY